MILGVTEKDRDLSRERSGSFFESIGDADMVRVLDEDKVIQINLIIIQIGWECVVSCSMLSRVHTQI